MWRVALLLLPAALAALGLSALGRRDPGYLLLAYGPYTLESSLWVGLLFLILLLALFWLLAVILIKLLAAPRVLRHWSTARRARHARELTERGLLRYFQGDWKKARSLLLDGASGAQLPWLNYLLAARACHNLGRAQEAAALLRRAREAQPASAGAVERVQAGLSESQSQSGNEASGSQQPIPS